MHNCIIFNPEEDLQVFSIFYNILNLKESFSLHVSPGENAGGLSYLQWCWGNVKAEGEVFLFAVCVSRLRLITAHTHTPPLWGETGLGELSPEATAMPLLSPKLSRLWDFINQASSSHFFGCPLLTWSQLCLKFLHSWSFQQFSDALQVCCSSMVSPQPYTTSLPFPFPRFPAVAFCLLALTPPFWAFPVGDPCISMCTSRCQMGLAQASQLPEDFASSGRCRKPCLYCQWDVAGTSRRH